MNKKDSSNVNINIITFCFVLVFILIRIFENTIRSELKLGYSKALSDYSYLFIFIAFFLGMAFYKICTLLDKYQKDQIKKEIKTGLIYNIGTVLMIFVVPLIGMAMMWYEKLAWPKPLKITLSVFGYIYFIVWFMFILNNFFSI